jgi:hypothetical protein
MTNEKPQFQHDGCPDCKFLGKSEAYDVWVCFKYHPENPTIIVRWGDKPHEYFSPYLTHLVYPLVTDMVSFPPDYREALEVLLNRAVSEQVHLQDCKEQKAKIVCSGCLEAERREKQMSHNKKPITIVCPYCSQEQQVFIFPELVNTNQTFTCKNCSSPIAPTLEELNQLKNESSIYLHKPLLPKFAQLQPIHFQGTFNGCDVYTNGEEIIVKYGNLDEECSYFTKESLNEILLTDTSQYSQIENAAICFLYISLNKQPENQE